MKKIILSVVTVGLLCTFSVYGVVYKGCTCETTDIGAVCSCEGKTFTTCACTFTESTGEIACAADADCEQLKCAVEEYKCCNLGRCQCSDLICSQ